MKEKITQQDALIILLNYRPKITFESISSELPAYYKKNLVHAVQELICDELVNQYPAKDGKIIYGLTRSGKNAFNKRFAELRKNDETVGQLEEMMHAFTV